MYGACAVDRIGKDPSLSISDVLKVGMCRPSWPSVSFSTTATFFQWVRTLACQCSAYFNCVTGGTNAPPVPAFVSPALVICPSFHDSIYGETNGKVEYNYRQMSDISLIYPKRRGEIFLSRFAFTV